MAQPTDTTTLFVNGSIYTAEKGHRFYDTLAVQHGKVRSVGFARDIQPGLPPDTRVIDLQGKMIVPGFTDSHVHPVEGHLFTGDVDLSDSETPEAILDGIRRCAQQFPEREWVFVGGAQLASFGAYPTRALLDPLVPDRPLLMISHDVHSACLNSVALARLGLTRDTPDPAGGIYERDPATGELTGVVQENGLYNLLRFIPQLGAEAVQAAIGKAVQLAHSHGITGWFDAMVKGKLASAYATARDQGLLKVNASLGMLATPHLDFAGQILQFRTWREQWQGGSLHLHTVKIFIDGVIEAHTASLLDPYADTGGNFEPHWTQAQLNQLGAMADQAGFDLHFHTLGDRAVRMALDTLEHVQRVNGKKDRRPQLAHLQIIHPEDLPRFHRLGAIASIQGTWAAAKPLLLDQYRSLLGEERFGWNYVIGSLRNAGAMLSGGSDWSVSTIDPLVAIQTAVTRIAPDMPDLPPWLPEQKTDLETMLEAYTWNSAWALRFDRQSGSLAAGKDANLAILERDLFDLPVSEIARHKVVSTFFQGEQVYAAPHWNR
ncbi:amidohydrolase [Leeia oryzae]|uniref:amidohydrolase n=1 Tax=Leeia oryzae TaxID=356662 RepID=UPI000377F68C|nr:amidohydrolase [Leeia oryzae]